MATLESNPVYCFYDVVTAGATNADGTITPPSTQRYNVNYLVYNKVIYFFYESPLYMDEHIFYLKSINKSTGATETHVFDNTNGETLTQDYLYFIRVTDLEGNELVEETRLYGSGEFPHNKVYGICDSKCRVEVPTKTEFDEVVTDVSDLNNRIAVISKSDVDFVINANGALSVKIGVLPDDFTWSNCIPLGVRIVGSSEKNFNTIFTTDSVALPIHAYFNFSNVWVRALNLTDSSVIITDKTIEVILYRYA